jgi:glycosyltransferase involved in cell wall biosynthesis
MTRAGGVEVKRYHPHGERPRTSTEGVNDVTREKDPRGRAVLYFGNDWGADNRTSSHHIARWMAKRHQVYYVECPGLRPPKTTGRDFKKIFSKLWRFLRGARQAEDGIKVRTLLQLPFHRFALVRGLNRLLVLATLRWMMWREGVRRPIAWFMVPHLAAVVGRLNEELSVYYCIDDYATLPDVNKEVVRAMDEELARKADLVFVSAESLLERKLAVNRHTHFSPHGVDVELFGRAQDERTQVPADTAHLPGPVVGFFGLIEEWVDLELIDYLAERRPQWTFLLIGRVAVPDAKLPRRPNVHFVGKRPYESLPAYGKQFDAAVIPFKLTEVILHANPLKLREYLAMGKPVVTVSTPEIDKYADVVEVAHSKEEYLAKLDAVLSRPPSAAETRRRLDRVAAESWDARIREVFEVVERHLGREQTGPGRGDQADRPPAGVAVTNMGGGSRC